MPDAPILRKNLATTGLPSIFYGPNLPVLYTGDITASPEEMYRAWVRGDSFPCPKLRRMVSKYTVPAHIELIWIYTSERHGGLWIDLSNPANRAN